MESTNTIKLCLNCGNPIPLEKRCDAIYCKKSCKLRGCRLLGKKHETDKVKGFMKTKK